MNPGPQHAAAVPRPVRDATCLACGCLCDDVVLHLAGNRIVRAERACPSGERWFLAERPPDLPVSHIDGRPAVLEAGIERAEKILRHASSPLVFGLVGATCEAQRAAIELADRLRAVIDIGGQAGTRLADRTRSAGMVTATLGEVRHRADLVMFWGVDPAATNPRHFERYSLTCKGEFVPRGRADRTCLVIDNRPTATADAADLFLQVQPGSEAAAIEVLRKLAAGHDEPDAAQVSQQTGVSLEEWGELVSRLKAARYGALFFDAGSVTESLLLLVRELNRDRRFVALPLGSAGNKTGAEQVLTWQTGHASAVSFATGQPEYEPDHNSAAAMLAGGKADAGLVVASEPLMDPLQPLPEVARARLAAIPSIVLHAADYPLPIHATVSFTVATPGIHTGGTVFRSDGVALPLRPACSSQYPTAAAVLGAIQNLHDSRSRS